MSHAVRLVFLCLGIAVGLLVLGLFAFRLAREARERRDAAAQAALRGIVFTALLGEPEESDAARAELRGRTGRAWQAFEEQAFAMIPKIKGDARAELVALLLSRGASVHAMANARSRSHVRRARGATSSVRWGSRTPSPPWSGCCPTPRSWSAGWRCVRSARSATRSRWARCWTRPRPTRSSLVT